MTWLLSERIFCIGFYLFLYISFSRLDGVECMSGYVRIFESHADRRASPSEAVGVKNEQKMFENNAVDSQTLL